jgi:transposase InsO family protein
MGRVARWLGEDADRVADQRSLAELNYVHISVNTVHLSRSASTKGDGARRQGRIAPAGHASFRRLPLPTGDRPRCGHPTPHHQDRCRPKAHLPTGGGRGAGRLYRPSGSGFSSAACVNVCDRAGAAAFHRPIGSCLDNAVAESPFATLKASSSTASISAPAPKREPRSSAAVEGALPIICRALGSPVVAQTVTDPSAPRGRPPSRRRPPSRKPNERAALLLGQAATRRASNLAAAS